jgi:hypothetical protein
MVRITQEFKAFYGLVVETDLLDLLNRQKVEILVVAITVTKILVAIRAVLVEV